MSKKWYPPRDMSLQQAELVASGKMCGAKLPKGGYCKRTPMAGTKKKKPPFRCAAHGGAATGAKKGSKHNLKHGFYGKAYTPEELEIFASVNVGKLDEEIKLAKIRLRRAVIAEKQQAEMLEKGDAKAYTTREVSREVTVDKGKSYIKETKRKSLVNWSDRIHNIVNQIVKLESQRYIFMGGAELTPAEQARKANEFLRELQDADQE